jgi:hypothetical protein
MVSADLMRRTVYMGMHRWFVEIVNKPFNAMISPQAAGC